MTTKRGGPRAPGPGKLLGRPRKTDPKPLKDYIRSPVEPPAPGDEREEAALEWWKQGLDPWQRLQVIVKSYYS